MKKPSIARHAHERKIDEPLSAPPRRHLHTRTIKCEGYERDDGLYDIEAQIIDTKTYAVDEPYRGHRPAGAPVHDAARHDAATMTVRDRGLVTDHAPYDICPSVAPGYQALIGAKVGGGWRKAVSEAVGRTKGCTHITELLMPAATVAFQTMGSWQPQEDGNDEKPRSSITRPKPRTGN